MPKSQQHSSRHGKLLLRHDARYPLLSEATFLVARCGGNMHSHWCTQSWACVAHAQEQEYFEMRKKEMEEWAQERSEEVDAQVPSPAPRELADD